MGLEYYAINETEKVCYELGKGDWEHLNFHKPLLSQIEKVIDDFELVSISKEEYAKRIYNGLAQIPFPIKLITEIYDYIPDSGEYTIIGTRYNNGTFNDFPMHLCTYLFDNNL